LEDFEPYRPTAFDSTANHFDATYVPNGGWCSRDRAFCSNRHPDLNILNNPFGPITRDVGSKAAFRVVANGASPIGYQWFGITEPGPPGHQGAFNSGAFFFESEFYRQQ